MTPTLAAAVTEKQVESVLERPSTRPQNFCAVCFTDRIVMVAEGVIYCPDCGQTTQAQSGTASS